MLSQPMQIMASNADIIVYARDRRLALAVEITSWSESTVEDAIALRRDLLAHRLLPRALYFLIVDPTAMLLWREETPQAAPPDYSASAETVLKDYCHLENGKRDVCKGAMELVVFDWLCTIANGVLEPDPTSPPGQMLIESGLYEEIRSGDVQFDPFP